MAIEITQQNFQAEVLEAQQTVLVDFWAPWCGPCRMQAPVLEQFAQENPQIKVVKVNVDECPELAGQFKIMYIPTLIVFRQGEVVRSVSSLQSLTDLANLVK